MRNTSDVEAHEAAMSLG